jgi:hypothetical protein
MAFQFLEDETYTIARLEVISREPLDIQNEYMDRISIVDMNEGQINTLSHNIMSLVGENNQEFKDRIVPVVKGRKRRL